MIADAKCRHDLFGILTALGSVIECAENGTPNTKAHQTNGTNDQDRDAVLVHELERRKRANVIAACVAFLGTHVWDAPNAVRPV